MSRKSINKLDFIAVVLYLLLVGIGLASIYSVVYEPGLSLFDFQSSSGKQLIWILSSFMLIALIFLLDYKIYEALSYIIYGLVVLLLMLVLVVGVERGGARSWFVMGDVTIQPAEFAKLACSLMLAKYLSKRGINIKKIKTKLLVVLIIALPALLILLQPDAGSVLIFLSFILVLYREGLSSIYLILIGLTIFLFVISLIISYKILIPIIVSLGLLFLAYTALVQKRLSIKKATLVLIPIFIASTFIYSVDIIFDKVLKTHHKNRILVLLDDDIDPKGKESRYNLKQSKIAIGAGGLYGRGYLNGTQTKLSYVPEQRTDFIFCTIGEEFGWIGSLTLIFLYIALLYRIVMISERQKDPFARIYGYCVASIIFFHFILNISMTVGLFPVIGVPLPFISYGGSSLWGFSLLLFILLKLDAHRGEIFSRA